MGSITSTPKLPQIKKQECNQTHNNLVTCYKTLCVLAAEGEVKLKKFSNGMFHLSFTTKDGESTMICTGKEICELLMRVAQ